MSNAKLAGFVRDITALQSYKDNTVCHAMTTGFGVRFHGFRRISFSSMAKVLKQFDKNMTFKPSPNGVVNLEARDMVDHDTCTGIVDPESLADAPHNLARQQPALNAGAVSRHEYKWSRTITDSLLHRLLAHPKVLDVWVEADRISVFVVHDNNLQGGLMQHITRNRKQQTKACKRPQRTRSSKSSWQHFEEQLVLSLDTLTSWLSDVPASDLRYVRSRVCVRQLQDVAIKRTQWLQDLSTAMQAKS